MRTVVQRLEAGEDGTPILPPTGAEEDGPDVVLAFLPRCPDLGEVARRLQASTPGALVVGCETVTQFANAGLTQGGTLHLFTFERPTTRVVATVLESDSGIAPTDAELRAVAEELSRADAVFVLCDGLRFPTQRVLRQLRQMLTEQPPLLVGGLASQAEPIQHVGARLVVGGRVVAAGCVLLSWYGVEAQAQIVRGWSPASPVYTVTRAVGNVLFEIDGEPAAAWYRRFFTVDGTIAPLPETAFRYPLIVEGPEPDRVGLYRSMKRFDEPRGAVTFWGDLLTGDHVRLGMGNDQSLVATAAELGTTISPEAAIMYSCVGREVVLGASAEAEIAAIHRVLGGVPLSGFFSFGEIGPTPAGAFAFYNQTAILALLRERA